MILPFADRKRLQKTVQLFFHAIEKILLVAQWLIHAKTCLQNVGVTLHLGKCQRVLPRGTNELSTLLAQVATCSTQTVNQNTNVPAEVCKVPIKRTSGLIVALLC